MTDGRPLVLTRPLGGTLRLRAGVVARLRAHAQHDSRAPESGGVLIGRWLPTGPHAVVDDITIPMVGDRQSRHRFFRSVLPHQAAVDAAWRRSGQVQTWLGDWHTHPEPSPSPSVVDRTSWRCSVMTDAFQGDVLFFLIVGLDEVCGWEVDRNGRRRSLRRA